MPSEWLEDAVYDALEDWGISVMPDDRSRLARHVAERVEKASTAQMERVRSVMEAHTVNTVEWMRSPAGQEEVRQSIETGAAILRGEPVPEREPARPPCVGWVHLSESAQDPPEGTDHGPWSCSLCFEPAARHPRRLVQELNVGQGMVPRAWFPGELEAKYQAWERSIEQDRAVTGARS